MGTNTGTVRKRRSPNLQNLKNLAEANIDTEETPAMVDFENQFTTDYAKINDKLRLSAGHAMIDMIRECTFKSQNCPNKYLKTQYL